MVTTRVNTLIEHYILNQVLMCFIYILHVWAQICINLICPLLFVSYRNDKSKSITVFAATYINYVSLNMQPFTWPPSLPIPSFFPMYLINYVSVNMQPFTWHPSLPITSFSPMYLINYVSVNMPLPSHLIIFPNVPH